MRINKPLFVFAVIFSLSIAGCAQNETPTTSGKNNTNITSQKTSTHTHTFSDEWTYDNANHWHRSTCGHDEVSDYGPHVFANWVVENPATIISTGLECRYCTSCPYFESREIPKIEGEGIGYEGGVVSDNNNDVIIEIPQGALNEETIISVSYIGEEKQISDAPQLNFLCGAEFGPSGTVFNVPVQVSLTCNKVPENDSLSIFCYSEEYDTWDYVTSATYSENKINFEINHFSKYKALDITPEMFNKYVSLVHEAQNNGYSDSWISDAYKSYLISEKHVMDYYLKSDGLYYEPCGLFVYGSYHINGKEGNGDDLSITVGESNMVGDTYGLSKIGEQTTSRAEYNKAKENISENQEIINVIVDIQYKMIKPNIDLSASKTKLEPGESTVVNVYCHYLKPENQLYPDFVLDNYPLTLRYELVHLSLDKKSLTTSDSGHASFTVTALDEEPENVKVMFYVEGYFGEYAASYITFNEKTDYEINGHVVQELSFNYRSNEVPGPYTISHPEIGTFNLKLEYDLGGSFAIDENNQISGNIEFKNITATLSTTRTVMEVYADLGGDYEKTVSSYHFFINHQMNPSSNLSIPLIGEYHPDTSLFDLAYGEAINNKLLEITGTLNAWAEAFGFAEIEREEHNYDLKATLAMNGQKHQLSDLALGGEGNNLTSNELLTSFRIDVDYDFTTDVDNMGPSYPNVNDSSNYQVSTVQRINIL